MRYIELDTPALLIDRERLMKNLKDMHCIFIILLIR